MITGQVSMETIGTAHTTSEYSEGVTVAKLSSEDEYARNLLKRSGVDFHLVDLSSGIGQRLRARFLGVRQTPVLVDGNNPPRFYSGVKEISQYVMEHNNSSQN